MTPQPKAPAKRGETPFGTIVAVTAVCSAMVSAAVAWTVVHFSIAEPKPAAVVAAAATDQPAPRSAPPMVEPEPVPPQESVMVERSPAQIPSDTALVTKFVSTAAQAYHIVLELQGQYDTNPYFVDRDRLKGLLDGIQASARQLQEMTAQGASAEEVIVRTQNLSTSLDQAISRLKDVANDKKSQRNMSEADITLAIKAKLEEMRATLP
jgi:hypothetical protein